MKVYLSNLGCKLNQAETDDLARRFLAAGHGLATGLGDADLHVVNSCHVTGLAARDSRKVARRGQRLNPALKTVVTGCYATAEPTEAAGLAGVDLVVPNAAKDELLERIAATFGDGASADARHSGPGAGAPRAGIPAELAANASSDEVPVPYVPLDLGHSRGLVKVEDGCNMRCAFCIIPSTRGRQRSRPVTEVVAEVRRLVAAGYAEVVVTGVQISEYDDEGRRLYDLVAALLAETAVPRLRLTSIAPWRFDDRLIELWRDPRLCRHVHLSLQSGSTATLKRMRRPYTSAKYEDLTDRLRGAIPGLAVTTDVIVGFPGETTAEFAESLAFVDRLAFARPHVFTYSPRPGTEAAGLPDHVDPAEKKARVRDMLAVARGSRRAFDEAQIGSTLGVVWESRAGERWRGLSDNYVRVFAEAPGELAGELGRVHARSLEDDGVSGPIVGRGRRPAALPVVV